jgi:hypothetical protein
VYHPEEGMEKVETSKEKSVVALPILCHGAKAPEFKFEFEVGAFASPRLWTIQLGPLYHPEE